MTVTKSGSEQVVAALDSAFETLAYTLDEIAGATGMKSDEMMRVVNAASTFAAYYADWIRKSWDNWEPVEVSA